MRAMPVLRTKLAVALCATALIAGCGEKPPPKLVAPVEISAESTGYYCHMLLADHEGPKGQIHLASRAEPVWFSSVRDTVAFTRIPGEPRDITAIYVNDMATATRWDQPERGAWVDANDAWFVIGSDKRGGMGAPEAVPFSNAAAAEAFRSAHGGRVARLREIPDAYVVGPEQEQPAAAPHDAASHR